jgi:hypothetical protein
MAYRTVITALPLYGHDPNAYNLKGEYTKKTVPLIK